MGEWNATPVQAISPSITLGYLTHELDEVSVTRSIYDAHPAHPHKSPSASAEATARPKGSQRNAVSTAPAPLGSVPSEFWPPLPGLPATVAVSDGAGLSSTLMTGVVDDVGGAFTSGAVGVSCTDLLERLDVQITPAQALLADAPPQTAILGFSADWRRVILSSSWAVDKAARSGGFYACAIPRPETVLAVPMMGSMWPTGGGSVLLAGPYGEGARQIRATPYGVGLSNVDGTWRWTASSTAVTTELVVDLPTRDAAHHRVATVIWDSTQDTGYYLNYNHGSDTITAGLWDAGTYTNLITLPRDGVSRVAMRVSRLAMRMRREGDTSDTVADGVTSRGTTAWQPDQVRANSADVIGGLEVAENPPAWSTLNTARTARIRPTTAVNQSWTAAPNMYDTTARQLLEQIADAECAAWWIDNDGVFQWAGYGVLESQPIAETITTLDSLADVAWTTSRDAQARTVATSYRTCAVRRSKRPSITLSQIGTGDLEFGDIFEQIVTSDPDVDWVNPDYNVIDRAGPSTTYTFFTSNGTIAALEQTNVNDHDASYWDTATPVTLEYITQQAFKWTVNPLAGTDWRVSATVPEAATNLPKRLRGQPGLILRGFGLITWTDVTGAPVGTGALVGAYEYRHDFGPWVQSPSARAEIRDHIVTELGRKYPVVTATVRPRPGRREGSRVRLVDKASTGLTLTCVIQQVRETWREGDAVQEITARVTDWTRDDTVAPVTPAPHWLQSQGDPYRAT